MKDNLFILILDTKVSNIIEPKFVQDSIIVNLYSNDSISFLKYSNDNYTQSTYFKINGKLFERRINENIAGELLNIDSILTFSNKDTIFMYKSVRRFIVTTLDLSYADCQYSIKKHGKEYITAKQSLVDTTYKEIFFYDKDYRIYKFINTWQDNTCVYVRKD